MRIPKYVYLNPFFRLCRTISEQKHVFVVGAPRSGTTLLANVIANHSNFCSLNSETDLFGWRSSFLLFEGKAGRHSGEFNKFRRQFPDVVQLLDGLADECKKEHGCETFVEKTPQHVFHLAFILKHFPESKIINVIRDPKDAFLSSKSNKSVVQVTPRAFAIYWKKCIEARQDMGDNVAIADVRYEQFVSSPSTELEQLMGWLGEQYEPSQIDPEEMSKHPLSGEAAFRLLGKKISTASVGRWRSELTGKEVETIDRLVGGL